MSSNDEKDSNGLEDNIPDRLCDLNRSVTSNTNQPTSSSHARVIDNGSSVGNALNKPNFPKSKPALLPKPKISASDLRIAKSIICKTQTCSQTVISVKSTTTGVVQKRDVSSSVTPQRTPPKISPKPKLPPKTGALRSLKENSAKVEEVPVRPPRSPKRTFAQNPFDSLEIKDSPLQPARQKSASLGRNETLNWTERELNKSSETPIKYFQLVNRKPIVRSASTDQETVPKPRPRLKNKPKLLLELDLATESTSTPIYATVDFSKKKNRRMALEEWNLSAVQTVNPDESFHSTCEELDTRRSSGSSESFKSLNGSESPERQVPRTSHNLENSSSNNSINRNSSNNNNNNNNNANDDDNNNNFNGTDNEKSTSLAIKELDKKEIVSAVDKTVLNNNYTCTNNNYTKESIETAVNGQPGDPSGQSLLVTSPGGQPQEKPKLSSVGSLESFVIVTEDDATQTESNAKDADNSFSNTNSSRSLSLISQEEARDRYSTGSSDLEVQAAAVTTTTRRFPWFGSFGKGPKKQPKKDRCTSQFYASSDMGSDADLNERSRAVSLPDIKHTEHSQRSDNTRIRSEEDDDSEWRCSAAESITSGSMELPHHSDSDDDKDSLHRLDVHEDNDKKRDKAYLIAKELMTSEEVFINVLRLLNVDFRNYIEYQNHENKSKVIPVSDVHKILNHLSQLQSLNEDLLSDLRRRIESWESKPKIADVIVKKGAFLKMYTTYIQSFEAQTKYLDECIARYPKFGKLVKEFESSEKCKKLTLKHYMLKPVQRIPQYRLLLDDYLKHLEKDSIDYDDTQTALKIVCEVADHANRSMKHGDKNGRMMQFQSLMSDFEIIKPGRQLIKDGPLEKVCRKSTRERYFILLNDCLLHTTYSRNYIKIHQDLPLSGMKVCCNEEDRYQHSFTVYSITRSFILCAKSDAERKEWVDTLQSAIEDYISRQKTMNVKIPETDSFKLGKEAPVWIQDSKVTMCQVCTAEFTALFRRHHCRGCGKVVCRNCGGSQAPLQYRKLKPDRVCDQCFDLLLKDYEDSENEIFNILKQLLGSEDETKIESEYLNIKSKFVKSSSTNSWKKQKFIPPRLKEVLANDTESMISGWLYRKSRRSWKLCWYVLKEHVLYVYKASEDVRALETMPVLGYKVERSDEPYEDIDKKLVFFLTHRDQSPIVFHAETEESAQRWFSALSTATNFDDLEL